MSSPMLASPAPIVSGLLVVVLAVAVRTALAAGRRQGVARRLPAVEGHRRAVPARLLRLVGPPPPWLAGALASAGFEVDPTMAWALWCCGSALGVPLALLLAGPGLGALLAVATVVVPLAFLRSRRGRGDARVEAALPGALESVARALRSGASIRQAVEEAARVTPGPLGEELSRVAVQAARGVPMVVALESLAGRRPLPGVRLAVAALCLGVETGGAQARAVDGVAATLRERLGVGAEVRALSAQARISALVIGLAPLGFGAFAAATDPRTAQFVFHTGPGIALLCAGLALDALGWLWMNRLSRVTA